MIDVNLAEVAKQEDQKQSMSTEEEEGICITAAVLGVVAIGGIAWYCYKMKPAPEDYEGGTSSNNFSKVNDNA